MGRNLDLYLITDEPDPPPGGEPVYQWQACFNLDRDYELFRYLLMVEPEEIAPGKLQDSGMVARGYDDRGPLTRLPAARFEAMTELPAGAFNKSVFRFIAEQPEGVWVILDWC